ncbi:sugar kinase, partial [uncultured Desulfovibrio sp.]|uniref:sugar kinase n=1 Tax=uncultured Desulfovibrio sp. TaxID=167968 RepID=UPI002636ED95
AALAATALLACEALGTDAPHALLAGDIGTGDGSRRLYAWLCDNAARLAPRGMTFHYLFPDADWHNRVLLALQALPRPPLMLADAGFMYAAKMSGYADAYDLFTPDVGELAFLADEKAPHPFYTRGFLLAEDHNIPPLLARVLVHGNCPRHLLIKGAADHIVCEGELRAVIDSPSVPAMECIGGTGDIVTGLVTAFAAAGWPLCAACQAASRSARRLAVLCEPRPDTPVADLIRRLPDALTPNWLRELEG